MLYHPLNTFCSQFSGSKISRRGISGGCCVQKPAGKVRQQTLEDVGQDDALTRGVFMNVTAFEYPGRVLLNLQFQSRTPQVSPFLYVEDVELT